MKIKYLLIVISFFIITGCNDRGSSEKISFKPVTVWGEVYGSKPPYYNTMYEEIRERAKDFER